jgi:mevalonate kinase
MAIVSVESSAPGKVILFGEHAVVYKRAAIAVPVTQVRATATVKAASADSGLTLVASDLGKSFSLTSAPEDDPLATAVWLTLDHLSVPEPDVTLTISSTIPVASGLGSGAAVSTALVRGLAGFLGHTLKPDEVSSLVFQVEKLHHGTPSGIDNTVVAYEQPVYFVQECPIQRLNVGQPFTLLIGDTGIPSPTGEIVGHVRQRWQRTPAQYDALFDQIGDIADEARQAIESGDIDALGPLMDQNHELLIELEVSSRQLNDLVETARLAGASGAKLSGAGQGGNMIALAEDDLVAEVIEALWKAGAKQVIHTKIATTD